MDKISVKCRSCGRELLLPPSSAGGQARCSCGNLVPVPAPSDLQGQPAVQRADAPGQEDGDVSTTRLHGALRSIFKDNPGDSQPAASEGESEAAQIPSTLLTVEYVDGSEGMDAALKDIQQRLDQLEQLVKQIQETTTRLAGAATRQADEMAQLRKSLGRRPARAMAQAPGTPTRAGSQPAVALDEPDIPPQYTSDQDHQKAWQVAQITAADLEAYHEDTVRQGALADNLLQVLEGPIREARKTYEQRVAKRVLQEFDYFTLALRRLVARKRRELSEEQSQG